MSPSPQGPLLAPSFLFLLAQCLLCSIPFLAAGRIGWGRGWALAVLILSTLLLDLLVIGRKNPVLLRERFRSRKNTKPWDKVFLALCGPLLFALLALAGLDGGRCGWSRLPSWTIALGAFLHIAGNLPVLGAAAVNPHLEGTVRIQANRNHRVVTAGPYRHVRHPMYLGGLLMLSGWPLVLGSWWAYLPFAAIAGLLVWRTLMEDRMLRTELPGYAAYAARTRHRLIPGLW